MAESERDLEALLVYLQESHAFDFTGYKRPTLARRITKRMAEVEAVDYADYLDYLKVNPEEFASLFDTILINVTDFFRDPAAWDHLAKIALPRLLGAKRPEAAIQVWSAGCASGQEAYTLAMVLAELLGAGQFQERVKVYATDADEGALGRAREGYTAKELASVPADLQEKYFEPRGSRFVFRADLRKKLVFGRHDLVQDAPISRIDILSCRNTLMYLTAETQGHVLSRFHYALSDSGLLFLGKAEMLLTHGDLFVPTDLKHRIFAKVPRGDAHTRMVLRKPVGAAATEASMRQGRLHLLIGDAAPVAQIAVDRDGDLVFANGEARRLFGVRQEDLGRPFRDLELSYRPMELRSVIEDVLATTKRAEVEAVERALPENITQLLDVSALPLVDAEGELHGVTVTFVDVTRAIELQRDVERARQELETAYEELQSANEELQTTNEELQSTVEELETTNEELQSSNEELQTVNDELQSSNDELESSNSRREDATRDLRSATPKTAQPGDEGEPPGS
jgi:two-component system CheB/CheR fusion protein